MRGHGRRVAEVAVFAVLLVLLVVPMTAFAVDAVDPAGAPVASPAAEEPITCEPPANGDAPAPSDSAVAAEPQAEPDVPQDSADSAAFGESADAGAADPTDASPPSAADEQSGAAGGSQVSSQANPDTQALVEAALKARKRQFDVTAAALQRSIDQLAAIIRRLDAANVNTSVARARLAEARKALVRAKAAERTTVIRFRSVIGAEDESAAYASARAAARTSSAQLERVRVKVLTVAKTLRAMVKNVTV